MKTGSFNDYLRGVFCVLDIESSGGPFGKEAMIEIAVYRFDGEEVVDQLISLVHPHREVQKFVTKMTGITPKMLQRAPRFHEIAKRIVEITEDAIIVGHNVEFDYRMLRQEFARLGFEFERETLDTIETAKELIPGLPAYGLSKVCKELGIHMPNKHRAEDDALATLELFKLLREKDRKKGINVLGQSVQKNNYLKDKLNDLLRSVKTQRGLFYLHDIDGKLLYIGASDNLKSAVNRVFLADSKRADDLRNRVHSIKTEAVGNWLIARIKREQELEAAKPPFNRHVEVKLERGIYLDKRSKVPKLQQMTLAAAGRKKPIVKSTNQKQTARTLSMFGRNFKSAEARKETLDLITKFPDKAVYFGNGRKRGEYCAFIVEGGQLAGYYYYHLNDEISHKERLEKSMLSITPKEAYTEMLKLGILSGEFKRYKGVLEAD